MNSRSLPIAPRSLSAARSSSVSFCPSACVGAMINARFCRPRRLQVIGHEQLVALLSGRFDDAAHFVERIESLLRAPCPFLRRFASTAFLYPGSVCLRISVSRASRTPASFSRSRKASPASTLECWRVIARENDAVAVSFWRYPSALAHVLAGHQARFIDPAAPGLCVCSCSFSFLRSIASVSAFLNPTFLQHAARGLR